MNSCVRKIEGVTYIDMERLWALVESLPVGKKLSSFLVHSGVTFFDAECFFVNKPVVAVTGFGGFPISFDEKTPEGQIIINHRAAKPESHLAEMQKTRGLAGLITNMNSGKHSVVSMDQLTTKLSHFSKTRTNIIDLHIFGYPAAIEPNFMRLYKYAGHVGCLTLTRTAAQSNPPWVILDPAHLPLARSLRGAMDLSLPSSLKGEALKDYQEGIFGFHPKNAAMVLMLNIDLQNLRGTMRELADQGQETAWCRIIALLNDQMNILFPDFFEPTSSYNYEFPTHWGSGA